MGELSHDLDRDEVQPYFIWDVPVTVGELKTLLRHPGHRQSQDLDLFARPPATLDERNRR